MAQLVKNPPAMWETWLWYLGCEDSPGGGYVNPLQYSCLENPHGQRCLAGYSPWGHKESNATKHSAALCGLSWNLALIYKHLSSSYYKFWDYLLCKKRQGRKWKSRQTSLCELRSRISFPAASKSGGMRHLFFPLQLQQDVPPTLSPSCKRKEKKNLSLKDVPRNDWNGSLLTELPGSCL